MEIRKWYKIHGLCFVCRGQRRGIPVAIAGHNNLNAGNLWRDSCPCWSEQGEAGRAFDSFKVFHVILVSNHFEGPEILYHSNREA